MKRPHLSYLPAAVAIPPAHSDKIESNFRGWIDDQRIAFGMPHGWAGIGYADQLFLDTLIYQSPQIINVVEFGTHIGLTSLMMGLTCKTRLGHLWTIDAHDKRHQNVLNGWLDNMHFHKLDLIAGAPNLEVAEIVKMASPCLLIVDNGDKIAEVRAYSKYLSAGDVMAVHDFGDIAPEGEIRLDDISDCLPAAEWEDICLRERGELRSSFRAWVRR